MGSDQAGTGTRRRTTVKIRGRRVTFSERVLKDGSTAFYRSGRRLHGVQIRAAKTRLRSVEPAFDPPKKERSRRQADLLKRAPGSVKAIERKTGLPHIEKWAKPVRNTRGKRTYYMLVKVVALDNKPGSHIELQFDDPDEIDRSETAPATVTIGSFSPADFKKNHRAYMQRALNKHGLLLPDGGLDKHLVAIWRHGQQ